MQSGKSITITVRVSHDMRDKLKALADKTDRTLSQYTMLVLRKHIEEQETKPVKK